jgi:hypothetical protein
MMPWFPTRGVIYQTDQKGLLDVTMHSAGLVECRPKELRMHLHKVSCLLILILLWALAKIGLR